MRYVNLWYGLALLTIVIGSALQSSAVQGSGGLMIGGGLIASGATGKSMGQLDPNESAMTRRIALVLIGSFFVLGGALSILRP